MSLKNLKISPIVESLVIGLNTINTLHMWRINIRIINMIIIINSINYISEITLKQSYHWKNEHKIVINMISIYLEIRKHDLIIIFYLKKKEALLGLFSKLQNILALSHINNVRGEEVVMFRAVVCFCIYKYIYSTTRT